MNFPQLLPRTSTFRTQLLETLEKVVAVMAGRGVEVATHTENALERVLAWSPAQQDKLLGNLSSYLEIINFSGYAEKETSFDRHCIQRALWKYGLFANDDLNDYLEKGDVIEIYDLDSIQIFRNFEFLKYCSYSLLDVMTQEWFVLYNRPQYVTEKLIHWQRVALQTQAITPTDIPTHIMKELCIENGKSFLTRIKYFIPLFSSQRTVAAFIVVIGAEIINSANTNVEILSTPVETWSRLEN